MTQSVAFAIVAFAACYALSGNVAASLIVTVLAAVLASK